MIKIGVISAEEKKVDQARLKRLSLALTALAKDKKVWVMTSLNHGAETAAAELALSLRGASLECVIPFEEQAALWSEEERDRYFSVIEQSNKETLVTTKKQENSERYAYTYMVNSADIILLGAHPDNEITELVKSSGKRVIEI